MGLLLAAILQLTGVMAELRQKTRAFATGLMALACLPAATATQAQSWILTSAPITNWSCVASSADGTKLAAAVNGGGIYVSTNSGLTWTETESAASWISLACSADGTQLFAAPAKDYLPIYRSTNSGANWQVTGSGSDFWTCVVCSADANSLAATSGGYAVTVSTNSGATWARLSPTPTPADFLITRVASSADGGSLDVIFQSSSYAVLEATPAAAQNAGRPVVVFGHGVCPSLAVSAEGTRIAAVVNNTLGLTPTNSGTLFACDGSGANAVTNYNTITNWTSVACSADAKRLVAVASGGAIYTSNDSGVSWVSDAAPSSAWTGVAISADGWKRVAVASGGGIYTWQSTPNPALNLSQKGNMLVISWIVPSSPFRLQSSPDLNSTSWIDVTASPVLNLSNLENEVIVPLSTAPAFYRLKSLAE